LISYKALDRSNLVIAARIWSADLTQRKGLGRALMFLNKGFDGLLELLDRVVIASLYLFFG
jgi:hypothetical protein